jgi:hypothetical protein
MGEATKEQMQDALYHCEMGLQALHDLAVAHENGVDGGTLSVAVEQMTEAMLERVRPARWGRRMSRRQ